MSRTQNRISRGPHRRAGDASEARRASRTERASTSSPTSPSADCESPAPSASRRGLASTPQGRSKRRARGSSRRRQWRGRLAPAPPQQPPPRRRTSRPACETDRRDCAQPAPWAVRRRAPAQFRGRGDAERQEASLTKPRCQRVIPAGATARVSIACEPAQAARPAPERQGPSSGKARRQRAWRMSGPDPSGAANQKHPPAEGRAPHRHAGARQDPHAR